MNTNSIWITWERQRRNRSMAERLGATLYELEYNGNRLARYCILGWKTARLIIQHKPRVLFYQNPSIILAALIATMKFLRITKARTVGDFHNAGVSPPVLSWIVPFIVRNTDIVIVSNLNLEAPIKAFGGRCISIPDPLPHLAHSATPPPESLPSKQLDVLFICSWAPDEPIFEVLRAAELLQAKGESFVISITGRPKLEKIGWQRAVPSNVVLTGFLPETEFEDRLLKCSAVLDLTTRADCMVCGAYEAASAEVPMIVSDNEPTRLYFHKGALFTDNSAESIAQLLLDLRAGYPRFKREVIELKRELSDRERQAIERLAELAGA